MAAYRTPESVTCAATAGVFSNTGELLLRGRSLHAVLLGISCRLAILNSHAGTAAD